MGAAAVVVGGGSGIGAALEQRYRATNTDTVVWDVAGECDIVCDVADPASVDVAVAATLERVGVPSRVTITAGISHAGRLLEVLPTDFDRVLTVNTRGPLLVLRAFAREMIAADAAGSMVATSSISARVVDRGMGLYCASKAALSTLIHAAALEWGEHGIRVNGIAPGATRTPMLRAPDDSPWLQGVRQRTPLGRLGEPADIVDAILALHALNWVTGQVLDCDGGLTLHSPIDAPA